MKLLFTTTLPLLLAAVALAQPDPATPGMADNPPEAAVAVGAVAMLNPDTPANAVRYFINALSNNLEYDLSRSVAGARVGYYGGDEWEEIRRDVHPFNGGQNLKVDAVDVDKQTDDTATVTVTVHSEYRNGGERAVERGKSAKYTLQLRREDNPAGAVGTIWRVVPLSSEEIRAKPLYQLPALQLSAMLALRDPSLLPFLRKQHGMSQLKQLALGALQFVQDYDEFYAFDDAAHERALLPYLKNKSLYTIAGTKDEKWHFNDNLSTKQMAQLEEVSRTVLFYDGSAPDSEHLNFRFDDKTLIGFTDGHVAALGKDELKDIIWKP